MPDYQTSPEPANLSKRSVPKPAVRSMYTSRWGRIIPPTGFCYDRVPVTQKDRDAIDEHFKTDPRFRQFYDIFKTQVKYPSNWPSTIDHIVADNEDTEEWELHIHTILN